MLSRLRRKMKKGEAPESHQRRCFNPDTNFYIRTSRYETGTGDNFTGERSDTSESPPPGSPPPPDSDANPVTRAHLADSDEMASVGGIAIATEGQQSPPTASPLPIQAVTQQPAAPILPARPPIGTARSVAEPVESAASTMPELSCPVCLEIMLQPKCLSCGHSLCAKCVKQIAARSSRSILLLDSPATFECPLCKLETRVAANEDLPTNFALRGRQLGDSSRDFTGAHLIQRWSKRR